MGLSVRNAVGVAVGETVGDAVGNPVGVAVGESVCTQLEGQFLSSPTLSMENASYWTVGINTSVVTMSLNPQDFLR